MQHDKTRFFGLVKVAVLFAMVWLPLVAQAQQRRQFDIPASDAVVALPELARQAGIQIIAPERQLAGIETPAVKGYMDVHAALRRLLAGTGLEIAGDDGRTITLKPAGAAPVHDGGGATSPAGHDGPAQAGTAGNATTQEDPAATATSLQPPLASAPAPQKAKKLRGVTVTGSFIRRIDVETALPLTTINQQDIDMSGAATVSDLLQQLPQAAAFDNNETSTGPNDARGDVDSINLRGLGSGNTLVLLNGHRIAPFPIASGAVPRLSANINQIPLGAVQRIEVLRDGASATYGSDAVAGVVNTILKKNYEGAEVDLRYGHVTEGGMGVQSANFLAGHNSDDGKTNIMGFIGYYNRNSLEARGKDYMQTGDLRARAHSDSTRWDNRSLSSPYGNFQTGHVDATGYFHSHVVDGMAGSQFHMTPTAGGVQLEPGSLPRSLRYDYITQYMLRPKTRRFQVFTALTHHFDNGVEAYGNFFYYHAKSFIANAASPISANSDNYIYVPASNYYNPFGTRFYGPGTEHPDTPASDVLIKNYRPVALGRRGAHVTSRAYQLVTGLRGMVGDWRWDISAQYGEGKTTDLGTNMMSESRLRHQLALDTPDAFNPFGGPGANSQEVLDAVRIDTWRTGTAGLGILDAKTTGELFEMPGGYVQAAVGVQMRHETFSDRRDPFSDGDDVIAQSKSADSKGSRTVNSVFAELYFPIFSESNAVPGLQRLELTLAGRSEHYSDFGRATKPKVSLDWSPVSWLLLRGSHSEGFRAPTLAQVFVGKITRRVAGIPDPYRADVVGSPADLGDESRQVIRGGNPDLGPEQAKENSFGFVLQVPFVEGLSLSADYFEIRQKDVIDTYGQEDQLNLDFQMRTSGQGGNSNVVRLPVTAADKAKFAAWNASHPDDQRTPVGAVDYVLDTFINIAQRKVSGVDFGFNYKIPQTRIGAFRVRSNVAYMDKFEEQKDAASPAVEQLEINGLPRLRGLLGVSWSHHHLRAGLRANYIGDFKDTSAPMDADGNYFGVSSYTTFNGYFGVKFGKDENNYLRLGINNLFDRQPPLADENRGYNDVDANIGRFIYVDWRMKL